MAGKPKHPEERLYDLFLRVPFNARQAIDAEAKRQGTKPVYIGRQIIVDWVQQQKVAS
jgi:hypothetical protein